MKTHYFAASIGASIFTWVFLFCKKIFSLKDGDSQSTQTGTANSNSEYHNEYSPVHENLDIVVYNHNGIPEGACANGRDVIQHTQTKLENAPYYEEGLLSTVF